jgi:hypothetical protein
MKDTREEHPAPVTTRIEVHQMCEYLFKGLAISLTLNQPRSRLKSLFTSRSEFTVLYDPEDQPKEKGIVERQPDRVWGLQQTDTLKRLLNSSRELRHSLYKDGLVSYPFLLIEAKSEKGSPGFECVERQSPFPIWTLLKLQGKLQTVQNVPIHPLVWFMANQGDEWRVYAGIVEGIRYICSLYQNLLCYFAKHFQRIIDLWHGCVLSLYGALQILLIIDCICDWARYTYRPGVFRCLNGDDNFLRSETPASIYTNISDFNYTDTITAIAHGSTASRTVTSSPASVDSPCLASLDINDQSPSEIFTIDSTNDENGREIMDYKHPYLSFCDYASACFPWRQHVTIRHSNMVLFSFHTLSIPDDKSLLSNSLIPLGDSGMDLTATCSHLLDLLEDDQSITVPMNSIHELESMWIRSTHGLTSSCDYPVRSRVLFHTYLREDWQVVREIHCVLGSRFAIVSDFLENGRDPPRSRCTAGVPELESVSCQNK